MTLIHVNLTVRPRTTNLYTMLTKTVFPIMSVAVESLLCVKRCMISELVRTSVVAFTHQANCTRVSLEANQDYPLGAVSDPAVSSSSLVCIHTSSKRPHQGLFWFSQN